MAEQMTMTATRTAASRLDATVLSYRRSPAHHLAALMHQAGGGQVRLREVPFLTQITIRAASAEAVEAVGDALGVALPTAVGEVAQGEHAEGGAVSVVWLSPDEWLAVLGDEAETGVGSPAVVQSLNVALGERRGQVVDVSANRTTPRALRPESPRRARQDDRAGPTPPRLPGRPGGLDPDGVGVRHLVADR